ncbi:hypothetical protein FO497_29250 [Bacillus cereus ATCC 10876]|nr:hypothetical protein [Bacillus cereus ATCC 10876]
MYSRKSKTLIVIKQNSYLIKIAYKKCTRLYKNYVLRAHYNLCLLYVRRDTLQYTKRALLTVLSDQN